MRIFVRCCVLFFTASLISYNAYAETYFLKIAQADTKDSKQYLQTCSPDTAPCKFMMPITLQKGGTKNLTVVIIPYAAFLSLEFYWDRALLGTNSTGEPHYKISVGASDLPAIPHTIHLSGPLSSEQTSSLDNQPVIKFSGLHIAELAASATMTKD